MTTTRCFSLIMLPPPPDFIEFFYDFLRRWEEKKRKLVTRCDLMEMLLNYRQMLRKLM